MSSPTEAPQAPEGRSARRSVPRVVWVAVAVAVLVAVGVVVRQVTHEENVPYDDSASTGLLTLCDTEGHAVTHGRLTDRPFAPIVLGSTPLDQRVPARAQGIATLYGFQPRTGVEPSEFSGAPIGGPVPFKDHAEPATEVVKDGYSIANFIEIYPAEDDGYVQLRLVLSAEGAGVITGSYDTADLKVDGDEWKLVRGGHASCADAASRLTP